jgi:hypothetical protein
LAACTISGADLFLSWIVIQRGAGIGFPISEADFIVRVGRDKTGKLGSGILGFE